MKLKIFFGFFVGVAFGYFIATQKIRNTQEALLKIISEDKIQEITSQQEPQDQFLRVYHQMQDAEDFEKKSEIKKAIEIYEVCLKKIEVIELEYPKWEPVIVKFRKKHFQEKIDKLKQSVQSSS